MVARQQVNQLFSIGFLRIISANKPMNKHHTGKAHEARHRHKHHTGHDPDTDV